MIDVARVGDIARDMIFFGSIIGFVSGMAFGWAICKIIRG